MDEIKGFGLIWVKFDFISDIHTWVSTTLLRPGSCQMFSDLFRLFCHLRVDPSYRYRFDLYHQITAFIMHHLTIFQTCAYFSYMAVIMQFERNSGPVCFVCQLPSLKFPTKVSDLQSSNGLPQLSLTSTFRCTNATAMDERHMTWCTLLTFCIQVTSKCSAKG